MALRRMVVLAALGGTALFALAPSPASVGAGTGRITKQSGWVTITSPRPGVHVQRKTIWVSGYGGARTITRVTWPIGNGHVSLDAQPLGAYRSSDAGFGGSRISAQFGQGGFIAGINGDTFTGSWVCSYCHVHGLFVHDRQIKNFGDQGPGVGFTPSGGMIMGQPVARPTQFLLKGGFKATVGAFGATPSSPYYDQIGVYTGGTVTLPANAYGVTVDSGVLSSLLRTSTPRSVTSPNGIRREPVQSFRIVEESAPGVTQPLPVIASFTGGSQAVVPAGQMLLVGRTGASGPYAGNALQRTVAASLPVRVTMSDQGWGSADDVMDGKFQLIGDSVAKTAYPGWSDPWPWSCMGSGYGCYRTAVGRNGNTGFLAIVGASHGYGGLTTADFARVLRSLGATQAMGFDANSAAEFTRNGKSPIANPDGGRIIPTATVLRYN
jgi:hypothetical protein